MPALARDDAERLLRFVAEAESLGGDHPFEGEFLGTVRDRVIHERDRAVVDLLNPHLVQLHRAAEARRRLREALALHESGRAAVVLLEADDRVAFASTAAHELLDRYFGKNGAHLPEPVMSWLGRRRAGDGADPLRIEDGDRMLVVERMEDALLLDERRPMRRLTPREREILELVAEGRTNAEIAERLWVSPLTVRRHLENIYSKLDVHTRTAAAAFVRELD